MLGSTEYKVEEVKIPKIKVEPVKVQELLEETEKEKLDEVENIVKEEKTYERKSYYTRNDYGYNKEDKNFHKGKRDYNYDNDYNYEKNKQTNYNKKSTETYNNKYYNNYNDHRDYYSYDSYASSYDKKGKAKNQTEAYKTSKITETEQNISTQSEKTETNYIKHNKQADFENPNNLLEKTNFSNNKIVGLNKKEKKLNNQKEPIQFQINKNNNIPQADEKIFETPDNLDNQLSLKTDQVEIKNEFSKNENYLNDESEIDEDFLGEEEQKNEMQKENTNTVEEKITEDINNLLNNNADYEQPPEVNQVELQKLQENNLKIVEDNKTPIDNLKTEKQNLLHLETANNINKLDEPRDYDKEMEAKLLESTVSIFIDI